MGFRNPITSAAAVDTRAVPTVAGVRMYEMPNPDTGQPYGVLEWDDGITGDTPARVVQTADANPHSVTTPYGRLAITAGAYAGKTGPELDLSVEQDSVGNPVAITRLTSPGGLLVNGQAWARQRAWSLPRTSVNLADSFPSGFVTALIVGTVTAAPPGDYLITLTMVLSGSVAAGGNAQLLVNTADVLSSPRSDVVVQAQPNSFSYVLNNYAGGDMALVGTQNVVTGTATIYTRGSMITVAYLGPRS